MMRLPYEFVLRRIRVVTPGTVSADLPCRPRELIMLWDLQPDFRTDGMPR
jgi:hypothetical protein